VKAGTMRVVVPSSRQEAGMRTQSQPSSGFERPMFGAGSPRGHAM
jgi:hypothetical protein